MSLERAVDWHCHILPGVDDGVSTMDESLAILKIYEDAGFEEVWLTPHIMEDVPNTTDFLRQRYAELKENYQGSIKLHLATENMIDNLFMERLEAGDLLTIGDNDTLLVETSYFSPPIRLNDKIENIKSKGYFPLLAHPERYNYINSFSTYRELRDMGVKFQVNYMSLCGHYGPVVKEKAIKLLSEGMVDRLGTDLHRREHIDIIRSMKLNDSLHRRVQDIINK